LPPRGRRSTRDARSAPHKIDSARSRLRLQSASRYGDNRRLEELFDELRVSGQGEVIRGEAHVLANFFAQPFYKLFVRGAGDNSIELRTVIVDDTDVLHDGIVDFPLTIHLPQLVNDGDLLTFG